MIKLTLRFGGDAVECIIDGNNLFFSDVSSGMITTVEGLKISKAGVIKEFPDLKDDEEWRKKSIERLKAHIKNMKSEKEAIDYIKNEMVKFGYTPLMEQRAGFRPVRLWKK